jgi:hypothetical protein
MSDIPEAPDVETQVVYLDKPCIISIDPVEVTPKPVYPQQGEDKKAWATEVREIVKKYISDLEAENRALRSQIEEHNSLEPKCSPD